MHEVSLKLSILYNNIVIVCTDCMQSILRACFIIIIIVILFSLFPT